MMNKNNVAALAKMNGYNDDKKIIAKNGLYANIHAKRERIASGSGERMRSPGEKGAPTAAQFKQAEKTVKAKDGLYMKGC